MTILRGGGGSTNIVYVPISAAREMAMIQIQTPIGCLRLRRGLGGATLGRDEEDTDPISWVSMRSWHDGRPLARPTTPVGRQVS